MRCCCCSPTTGSIGYAGRGDFAMAPDGRLTRRGERETVAFVYAGAAILRRHSSMMRPRASSRLPKCSTAPRKPVACTGCGSKGCGCMSARPQRSQRRKPRSRQNRLIDSRVYSVYDYAMPHVKAQRLQHPRLGAVSAGADRGVARRRAGAGLSGARRSVGLRGDALSADAARLPACARRLPARLDGDAAILPRIVALGDIDEDEIIFAEAATGELAQAALNHPPTLSRSNGGCCWPS